RDEERAGVVRVDEVQVLFLVPHVPGRGGGRGDLVVPDACVGGALGAREVGREDADEDVAGRGDGERAEALRDGQHRLRARAHGGSGRAVRGCVGDVYLELGEGRNQRQRGIVGWLQARVEGDVDDALACLPLRE